MPRPLPYLLSVVAVELGNEKAMHLAAVLGGKQITVPSKAVGSKLAKTVGNDIAAIIVREYAAETIYVPKSMSAAQVTRELVKSQPNASVNDLVELTGLSSRQIYRIRASVGG